MAIILTDAEAATVEDALRDAVARLDAGRFSVAETRELGRRLNLQRAILAAARGAGWWRRLRAWAAAWWAELFLVGLLAAVIILVALAA